MIWLVLCAYAVLASAIFIIIIWSDRRVVRPTTFADAARKAATAFDEVGAAMTALVPAAQEVTRAMNRLGRSLRGET